MTKHDGSEAGGKPAAEGAEKATPVNSDAAPVARRELAALAIAGALAHVALATSAAAQSAPRALFVFQYAPGPAWRPGVAMRAQGLGPHAAYMQRLQDEGRLFAGGGYASDDGGMAIVTARDMTEARALLAADPAVQSGVFVAHVREWRVRFRVDTALPPAPAAEVAP